MDNNKNNNYNNDIDISNYYKYQYNFEVKNPNTYKIGIKNSQIRQNKIELLRKYYKNKLYPSNKIYDKIIYLKSESFLLKQYYRKAIASLDLYLIPNYLTLKQYNNNYNKLTKEINDNIFKTNNNAINTYITNNINKKYKNKLKNIKSLKNDYFYYMLPLIKNNIMHQNMLKNNN